MSDSVQEIYFNDNLEIDSLLIVIISFANCGYVGKVHLPVQYIPFVDKFIKSQILSFIN